VICRFDVLADERIDLLVCLHITPGLHFTGMITSERRLAEDLARQPHTGAHLDPIVRMRQIVEEEFGVIQRVGGGQTHRSPALGAHGADVCLKAMLPG
jgi:hypothetical protein